MGRKLQPRLNLDLKKQTNLPTHTFSEAKNFVIVNEKFILTEFQEAWLVFENIYF